MPPTKEIVIAFDLYGTLLSTESIAKELATHFGDEKASEIAALWRRFQLEYTWRMNSMSLYKPFSSITLASLQHALSECSVSLPSSAIEKLMTSYDSLTTFPDVPPALTQISKDPNITAHVFSNGTPKMLISSLQYSPSLSPYAPVFESLISVDSVQAFKPSPLVYQHLVQRVGKKKGEEGDVWLVSGNPFDVVGARACGLKAAWVDREGGHHGKGGWSDCLGELVDVGEEGCKPTIIAKGVDGAVEGIKDWVEKNS